MKIGNFEVSREMVSSCETLMIAMAYEASIRPVVEEYTKNILLEHKFKYSEEFAGEFKNEFIVDLKHSYLMAENDALIFYAACFAARDVANLQVDDPEHCPLLVAENLRMQAENEFLKVMGKNDRLQHLAEPWKFTLETRKKVIDLSLRLVAPFVGSAKGLMADLIAA